jgi:hypothetical protein
MALPKINLDDKRYKEIVQEAIARIPAYTSDWTNFNESDPGITLLELFAWLIEIQIYKVNKIPDKTKLKFLQLLGDDLFPRSPQCAQVEFNNKDIPENAMLSVYDSNSKIQIPFRLKKIKSGDSVKNIAYQEEVYTDNYMSSGLPLCCCMLKKNSNDEMFSYVESVFVDGINAEVVNDFSGSDHENLHCVFNWEKGSVIFGDGYNGLIPEKNKLITITYITTLGKRGNVKAGTIYSFVDPVNGVIETVNEYDASGGSNGESIADAILRVQADFKKVTRAVTSDDYESLIMNGVPGIARVKALPCYHPDKNYSVPGLVTIVIVPEVNNDEDYESKVIKLKKEIYKFLDTKYRLVTTELYIVEAESRNLKLTVNISILPQYVFSRIEDRVKECIADYYDIKKGGTDQNGWPFGRGVYVSEIYRIIDDIEGVDYIEIESIGLENKSDKVENLRIPAHCFIEVKKGDIEVKKTILQLKK